MVEKAAGLLVAAVQGDGGDRFAAGQPRQCLHHAGALLPGPEAEAGVATEGAVETAQAGMQQPGPALGAGADVGLDEERLAKRQPARLGRQGHVQRQRLGRRQLMEQQRRQRAVATFGVVFQGHVHRRQQQLPQQRRHRQHLAVRRHRRGAAGLDVQAAGAHPEHSHLMLDARRNPHRALWRHHPAGVAGTHLHHSAGTVQQLRATVPMARQQVAVGIVGTHGHHGPGRGVVLLDGSVAHGRSTWPKHE